MHQKKKQEDKLFVLTLHSPRSCLPEHRQMVEELKTHLSAATNKHTELGLDEYRIESSTDQPPVQSSDSTDSATIILCFANQLARDLNPALCDPAYIEHLRKRFILNLYVENSINYKHITPPQTTRPFSPRPNQFKEPVWEVAPSAQAPIVRNHLFSPALTSSLDSSQ